MKPEFNSRRYFGITRSKGKMYELGLPEELHISIPEGTEPAALFPLTIGTLMDVSAAINDMDDVQGGLAKNLLEDIGFSASFFDAYLDSQFDIELSQEVTLLASASYFLGQRPGSSLVLARRISLLSGDAIEDLLVWLMQANWMRVPDLSGHRLSCLLEKLVCSLIGHFLHGESHELVLGLLKELRYNIYSSGSSREVLLIEVSSAVVKLRLAGSAWRLLPNYSELSSDAWAEAIQRPGFPKELWPSQKLLGKAGLFAGRSGVIQMPTSAGKTRSVEIILRSAFLADSTRVAVLVAPFRALCHEIATSLRHAFKDEDIKVNELSDALQLDFTAELAELFGEATPTTRYLLVLTPEKLLYILRQTPALIAHIGMVVYDEGHQFDTGPRGVTYELLLTEIKGLLPVSAQTILISAVIKNASAVGTWLIGDDPNVVDGTGLLSTARSIAFATWSENLGQLLFFESGTYERHDYFVPRSIESQELELYGRERKQRLFPEKGTDAWKEVSLYLGIRLAPNGAVAVFCGRKDTANGLAGRAVEVFERGFKLAAPAAASDAAEIQRLNHLATQHFGEDSVIARAATLGIFVHHGTTPQGLRLSIEYAMQNELIKLVICTSTLAQGVNLPIRYLIVSGVNQGADLIKTRDFQNLIGRAGRAGMHTEGLILFADPKIMDNRRTERWRLQAAAGLLKPENSEETSSSLLELLAPIPMPDAINYLPVSTEELLEAYFMGAEELDSWAANLAETYQQTGFDKRSLAKSIASRRKLLSALESYLMANRDDEPFSTQLPRIRILASSTLAYSLADDHLKASLIRLFELAAIHIERLVPEPQRQALYAKTLLGAKDAAKVEAWVRAHEELLLTISTPKDWLQTVWLLLNEVIDDKLLTNMEPAGMSLQLAERWMSGASYKELISIATNAKASKPWGESRRRLTETDILQFLEGCLGFNCSLVIAAVSQFLFGADGVNSDGRNILNEFQKSFKYGLPEKLTISIYDNGFADRCIAQDIASAISQAGYQGSSFGPAQTDYREVIASVLESYPAYFNTVLDGL